MKREPSPKKSPEARPVNKANMDAPQEEFIAPEAQPSSSESENSSNEKADQRSAPPTRD